MTNSRMEQIRELTAELMRAECEYRIITHTATPIGQLLHDVLDAEFYYPTFGVHVKQSKHGEPELYTATCNFARAVHFMDTKYFMQGFTSPRDLKKVHINFGDMIRDGIPELLKVADESLRHKAAELSPDIALSTAVFGKQYKAAALLMHRKYFSEVSAELGVSKEQILKEAENLATVADKITGLKEELSKLEDLDKGAKKKDYPTEPKDDLAGQVLAVLKGTAAGSVRELMGKHRA